MDNEAKGCLDDIALELNRETDATLVVVETPSAQEKPDAAAERTLNAKQYLTQEKGIYRRASSCGNWETAGRSADDILVPPGANWWRDDQCFSIRRGLLGMAMLMTSPINVSALGEMRVSASPCTMRSKSQPQARPKALVQVIQASLLFSSAGSCLVLAGFIVDRRQFEDFQLAFAVGRHNGGHVAHLLAYDSLANG